MGALRLRAERRQIALPADVRQNLADRMRRLPPHPDVAEALDTQGGACLRLATLTNSTAEVGQAQLANAGLRDYFEQALSADSVRRLMPSAEPYHYAAAQLGVPIGEILLIAAHAWDIAGALSAGCSAAFLARPGKALDPLVPQPRIIGQTKLEVADQILQAQTRA